MASTHVRFAGGMGRPLEFQRPLSGDALLRKLWWAQRFRVLGGMTAGIVWMGAIALVPVALGRVVDSGISQSSAQSFAIWISVVIALYLFEVMAWPIRHRFAMGLYQRTLQWCHELVGHRALDAHGGLDDQHTPGSITSLITTDSRRVAALLDISCRGAGSIVTFVGVLGAMLVVNWRLAGLVLGALVPLLFVLGRVMHTLEARNHALNRRLAHSSAVAADFITALRVVKGVGAEREAIDAYERTTQAMVESALDASRVRARALALDLVMPCIVVTIVAWYGAHLVVIDAMSIGQLVMFSGWSVFMVVPLLTFSEMGRKWAAARASARRLAAAFNCEPADPHHGEVELVGAAGDVRLGSIHVCAGEFVAIEASQATTRMIVDALRRSAPESGNPYLPVNIDGVPIEKLTLSSLRSTVLIAEHDAMLFAGTLRQNLLIAKPGASEDELRRALEAAAAVDILSGLRDGLDGVVAEQGRSLSGGQRQRVSLARAYLARTPVLVLVDPTSALDSFTEAEIVDRIRAERQGKTTIVFTSSAALVDVSDRRISLDEVIDVA
jgi:putative ABC transport system ATP-binding protein